VNGAGTCETDESLVELLCSCGKAVTVKGEILGGVAFAIAGRMGGY
jgi:hypothetical protein